MRGCLTLPTNSLHDWPGMETPNRSHIDETDTTFAIGWKGHYRIEGPAFIYVDRDTGRTSTILGYPMHQLTHIG